jgi:hypothetical protein
MLLNKPFDWIGYVALGYCGDGEFVLFGLYGWVVLVEGCEKQIDNF